MKIQCSCGTKYSFEVTPEMAARPIQFICRNCGTDSTAVVNEMIRRELNLPPTPVVAAPPPPAPIPAPAPVSAPAPAPAVPRATSTMPAPPPSAAAPRLAISRSAPAAAAPEAPAAESSGPAMCFRHAGQPVVHQCSVCKKPMCGKCMQMFGYVCSPFCKNKAEAQGIDVGVFAGQKSVAERRAWRKVGMIVGSIAAVLLGLVGFWIWYSWFGSVPKPIFAVRFEEFSYSGHSQLAGKNQIVFLHGGTLYRHDMNAKKEIWSRDLIDKKLIDAAVDMEIKGLQEAVRQANDHARDGPKIPARETLAKDFARGEAASLDLYVRGSNIWVTLPGKLVRYDWETGNPVQEVPLRSSFVNLVQQGDDLVTRNENSLGQLVINHVSLVTGETRIEKIGEPRSTTVASAKTSGAAGGKKTSSTPPSQRNSATAGLPLKPGADRGKPLDPEKVAEQASHLTLPGKIALPAVLANSRNQERTLNALDGDLDSMDPEQMHAGDYFNFIAGTNGFVQFSAKLLEEKIVTRKAMKDPPKKSALDGNVNASSTMAVANEILNDMQRERGGDSVQEDLSRYQVTVRRPDGQAPDWTAEVVGPPHLFVLDTVNVVTAGTSLTVLDKMNKKLWQATLTHRVNDGYRRRGEQEPAYGLGPCVERGDRLYVFDEAVLTAFELASGNARWRLPSVGISKLFFDDKGMLFVNTTSADPESLKFARQIDITSPKGPIVLKIDPKEGKILWASGVCGPIYYLSGKFIYTIASNDPGEDDQGNPREVVGGLEAPAYLQIRRINPSNGRMMWEHYQKRCPVDVEFNDNTIRLVFKKEVQVLKYLSF